MPAFDALERLASRAVDRVFGERLRVDPEAAGGEFVRAGPDTSRASYTVAGIVDTAPVVVGPGAGPALSGERVHISLATPALPYLPRQGDRVVAIDRPGSPAFIVTVVEPDDAGRVLLKCKPDKEV